jgi:hypothetical protein
MFKKSFLANIPLNRGLAGKAQTPEVLCGILMQQL